MTNNTAESEKHKLTSGKLLARNTIWNFVGYFIPVVLALLAIPPVISGLGVERFGLLTIVWAFIGYFSLLDLGIGRALTQLLAKNAGSEAKQEMSALIWTSLLLLLLMGLVGAASLAAATPWLVKKVLNVPVFLHNESVNTFYIVALSIPVITTTAALRGVLEAKQLFFFVNAGRLPLALFTLVGPLLVLPFTSRLDVVAMTLFFGRIVVWAVYLFYCLRVTPELMSKMRIDPSFIRRLLYFGTWMTVSNVVSPIMTNLDRFFIGALLSISVVAFYATPHEIVTKLLLIPSALVGVLFPAFATAFAQDKERVLVIFQRAISYVFISVFPLTVVMIFFAYEGLDIWLGRDFAANGEHVVQLLSIGVFMNCLAYIPFALLQGAGRPDITGKLQFIELPFYLLAFWALVHYFGIVGAAAAWALRVIFESFLLLFFTQKILPGANFRRLAATVSLALFFLGTATGLLLVVDMSGNTVLKSAVCLAALVLFIYLAWRHILGEEDKNMVRKILAHGYKNRLDRAE